mmetsp:Transcript_8304/g.19841  ORF Transcript_8304/g.19841 Transcript_8304/m.19841 type:complete len:80 (+) Transcript_8304:237-476(+)
MRNPRRNVKRSATFLTFTKESGSWHFVFERLVCALIELLLTSSATATDSFVVECCWESPRPAAAILSRPRAEIAQSNAS